MTALDTRPIGSSTHDDRPTAPASPDSAATDASKNSSTTTDVVRVDHLKVIFGSVEAVRDVSLTVRPGEIFGLLGRNGAGKTTTISVLAGLLRPTSGSAQVLGMDCSREEPAAAGALALQPQRASLFPRLTVQETLTGWAGLYGNPRPVDELIDALGLREQAKAKAGKLSGGQAQRLLLATALIGRTPLVVLDEPTTGLDPHARRAVWDVVQDMRADGTTFLLSTHAMDEAEEMCDRLALIHRGSLITTGSPTQLIAEHTRGDVVTVRTGDPGLAAALSARFGVETHALAGDSRTTHRFAVSTDRPEDLLAWLRTQPDTDARVRRATVEDVFLQLTGEDPAAAGEPEPDNESRSKGGWKRKASR